MTGKQNAVRWLKRYALALTVGGVAAFSLLWVMQFLIATGEAAITEQRETRFVEFVRVIPDTPVEPEDDRPDKPDDPPPPPPPITPNPFDPQEEVTRVFKPDPPPSEGGGVGEIDRDTILDGDLLPLVRVAPEYPLTALRRGLEGYCDVECTVTPKGTTDDVRTVYCTSALFKRASIKAVQQFKYKPRVVNGVPLAVSGVRYRVRFEINK